MILDELVLHNFGVFRGRQQVRLTPVSAERPITLFGGLNGAGKTTIMEALLLALFGRHAPGLRGSGGYESYLRRSIHRGVPPREGASLEIRFRSTVEGKERMYCVTRSWTASGKRVNESVDVFVDDRLDRGLSETWAERVDQFLPARLAPLFFFDGERIESLADSDQTAEMLSTAMHALLGIDLVDTLQSDLMVLERRKRKDRMREPERAAVDEAEAAELTAREQLDAQRQDVAGLKTRLERSEHELKRIDQKYAFAGGELAENRVALEEQTAKLAEQSAQLDGQLVEAASGALPFALVEDLLRELADQAEREAASARASVLLETLRAHDTRIVELLQERGAAAQAVDDVRAFVEREQQDLAAATDETTYLDLDVDAQATLSVLLQQEIAAAKDHTASIEAQSDELTAQREAFETQMAATPDTEALNELAAARQQARDELASLEQQLAKAGQTLDELTLQHERAAKHLDRLHEAQREAEIHNQDAMRFESHSSRLREVLTRFRGRVVGSHLERLETLILESYRQLLRKSSLVTAVRIDPSSYTLELLGPQGQTLPPERLSAGERQLLAVAILWALARASGRPLPTAIDTPLGRLDASHRKNLVDRYFPYASHQVLIFSTDEEIDDTLLESMKRRVGQTYRLVHDDDTSSTSIEQGYFW